MTRLRTHPPDRQRGAALFLAILVLFILTVMGIALMFTTSIEQTLAGTETKVSKVFYAADSGIEFGAGRLRSDVNFVGGNMPVGVSSHYPSMSTPDIQVAITKPIVVGNRIHPGDQFVPMGVGYGTPQVAEVLFSFSSTASTKSIQVSKNLSADVGIYPQIMSIIPQ